MATETNGDEVVTCQGCGARLMRADACTYGEDDSEGVFCVACDVDNRRIADDNMRDSMLGSE